MVASKVNNNYTTQLSPEQKEKISSAQIAFLSRLINRVGRRRYLRIKAEQGLAGVAPLAMTKDEAGRLIRALAEARR